MRPVLFITATDQRRGAETFASELATELRSRGRRVELVAVQAGSSDARLDIPAAGRGRLDPRGLARMVTASRRAAVVVSFGSTSLQPAALAAAVARRPFVYRNIGDPAAWHDVRGARLRVGWPLRRAARVVAVFPGARDALVSLHGLDPARVVTIPRGVPDDKFPVVTAAERAEARASLGLDPDRRWVAWVGSLSAEKDPGTALAAVDGVADAGLLLCGEGPLRAEVELAARTRPDVVVLGPLADVRPALAAAEVLLLTSRTEGVPGVVIEAGLSGLPAVASDVGGVSWVVDDGFGGRLVRPGDSAGYAEALRAVLAEAPGMGAAAARRCREMFSMRTVADAWERLIDDVAGG